MVPRSLDRPEPASLESRGHFSGGDRSLDSCVSFCIVAVSLEGIGRSIIVYTLKLYVVHLDVTHLRKKPKGLTYNPM